MNVIIENNQNNTIDMNNLTIEQIRGLLKKAREIERANAVRIRVEKRAARLRSRITEAIKIDESWEKDGESPSLPSAIADVVPFSVLERAYHLAINFKQNPTEEVTPEVITTEEVTA